MAATGYKYIMFDKTGYKVRFLIARNKRLYKNFVDLDTAIRWRNATLKKHGLIDRLKYDKAPCYFREQHTNPIIGVYIGNSTSVNWVAAIGNGKKKTFSIEHHGNKAAFQKACRARYKYAGKLRVINWRALPCKPTVPHE